MTKIYKQMGMFDCIQVAYIDNIRVIRWLLTDSKIPLYCIPKSLDKDKQYKIYKYVQSRGKEWKIYDTFVKEFQDLEFENLENYIDQDIIKNVNHEFAYEEFLYKAKLEYDDNDFIAKAKYQNEFECEEEIQDEY